MVWVLGLVLVLVEMVRDPEQVLAQVLGLVLVPALVLAHLHQVQVLVQAQGQGQKPVHQLDPMLDQGQDQVEEAKIPGSEREDLEYYLLVKLNKKK